MVIIGKIIFYNNMNMKKIFYVVIYTIIIFPVTTYALTKPDDHGLATNTLDAKSIVESVTEFVTAVIASLAILMIVISGIMYMTSGGDQQKAETAKKMLTYAIIGLVVALLAYAIVIIVGNQLGAW